jgi:hypothetical protein
MIIMKTNEGTFGKGVLSSYNLCRLETWKIKIIKSQQMSSLDYEMSSR